MKRVLGWTAFSAGVLLVVVLWLCLGIAAAIGRPGPIEYGNRRMPENGKATARIAVLGDTQKGLAAFAALLEIAKREGVDLAVHTGDLVSHADAGHYDLALTWVERARLGVPFLVTPGNHDLKGNEGLFPDRIGPLQLACRWGPVDIVIVNNSLGPPDEASVERLLAAAKGPVLLFMHVPPFEASSETYIPKPAYKGFLEMLRKHPVRYVFCGHAHTYRRIVHEGTVFIANGVGGDSDSWQFDQRAYVTIVEIAPEGATDRAISIEPVVGLWANVEHLAVGHVGEVFFRRFWGFPGLLLLIAALILGYRKLRKKAPEVTQTIGLQ
ncbi:MAG TPA: metallophosphoesterase [Planctomycetota bacterium]|nr:metallophosphoesterase [Planctomycetota bacterium]